jgi:uncharacterized coiled-coil DUF342 family protein
MEIMSDLKDTKNEASQLDTRLRNVEQSAQEMHLEMSQKTDKILEMLKPKSSGRFR